MINLRPIIDRINALLAEDTEASITYAALEARLAIEKVVYDRLRQRHDYISHEELRTKWQPRALVNTLMQEVDPHIGQTVKLSVGKNPNVKPQEDDYVELGTEVGFNSKRIAGMWQALANLALHVRLPEHKNDHIADYGDKQAISEKVQEVVKELERLSKTTLTMSGLGKEVHFDCTCGHKNKRRSGLLRDGQYIYCINPDCIATWKVEFEGDDINFETVTVEVPCKICGEVDHIPWRMVVKMKYDEMLTYPCHKCGGKNFVKWQLMQATSPPPSPEES